MIGDIKPWATLPKRVVSFALIFVVGSLTVSSSAAAERNLGPVTQNQEHSAPAEPTKQQLKLISLADGMFEGVHGTFKTYKAEDGELVWVTLIHRQSVEDAKKLYITAKDKASMLKEEPVLDESGNVVGETAVLTAPSKDGKRTVTIMIVRIGTEFREVESHSSSDALALGDLVRRP